MNELIRLIMAVIPLILALLVGLCVVVLLGSLGPVLIPAAIVIALVLVGWGYFGRRY